MTFKFKSIMFFLAMAGVISFSSCGDDDDDFAMPVISDLEVGYGNSLTALIGGDLHIDATIVADGTIDKIEVELHPESGNGEDIEAEYMEFSGLKNADFHKHIDIPATAVAGEYHFHLKVYDQQGQMTEADADVMIEEPSANAAAPVITNLVIGENNNLTGSIGGDLHIEAGVVAEGKIQKIEVKLHPEGMAGEDIEQEFTTGYVDEISAHFHDHIEIPATAAAGDYHFHLKVYDQEGQMTEVDAEVTLQ